jgi:hypothetical protein
MANIHDMIEDYLGRASIATTTQTAVSWGIKNGLVKQAPPSKGTDYNWQLSRRIKRNEADRQRTIKKLQRLLEQ